MDHAASPKTPLPGDPAQTAYWDKAAGAKDCTLSPALEFLRGLVPAHAPVLDLGCGYGRCLARLRELGFSQLTGLDTSPEMIARGKREHPCLTLRLIAPGRLPFPDASFAAVLLVGVLTAVPNDDEQRRIIGEIARVLVPGGILFLADFPIQDDARNQQRYARFSPIYGRHGVFAVDGGVMRHHELSWLDALTRDFLRLDTIFFPAVTLNGHPARAVALTCRKPE